eukprot:GHVR01086912.1.p1 GENE.GHVR01086912.1~~GHVR01086912.1.p1  ORF type:complete len:141 (-),score=35.62 GHVR01086912.1:44-466(-)
MCYQAASGSVYVRRLLGSLLDFDSAAFRMPLLTRSSEATSVLTSMSFTETGWVPLSETAGGYALHEVRQKDGQMYTRCTASEIAFVFHLAAVVCFGYMNDKYNKNNKNNESEEVCVDTNNDFMTSNNDSDDSKNFHKVIC